MVTEDIKEKVKNIFTKGLVSLEILKLNKKPDTVEEAESLYDEIVKHKTFLIDDIEEPLVIRLSYTENKKSLSSVDPNFLSDMVRYEVSESIQDILRNEGFPIIESNFPQPEVAVD